MSVCVRFKDTPQNPCPASLDTPAERSAWQRLRGMPIVLTAPIASSLMTVCCGSDTYWEIVIDEAIALAASDAGYDPGHTEYAVCRHVLDMGD